MREDWIECKSSDLLDVRDGTHDTPKYIKDGGFPLITSKNLIKGNIDFLNTKFISEIDMNLINQRSKVDIGDILFAMIGTIGNPVVVKEEPKFSIKNIGLFKNKTKVIDSLLFKYFLDSPLFLNQLDKRQLLKGTTQKFIPLGSLRDINFPLSPLPEQRAIVKKLESLFSSLDAGVADLKKAQQQLNIYRQAVLRKAFDSDNKYVSVGKCFSFLGGGTPSKQNKAYWNGNIHWASIKDIKGDILNNTIDYITEDGLKNSSSNLAEKDEVILATRINPGKTIISNIRTAINQDLKVIKPLQKCDYKYVHYLFKSIEHKCLKVSSGTTVLGISLPNLKEIEIPFEKDIDKQAHIVKQIESRLSVCDSIENNIKESLEKAEALRQSILKKAFEGNLLTAQELAECKLAPDYEPASVLLERIKAEQTEIKAKPSKKKPRHSVAKSQ